MSDNGNQVPSMTDCQVWLVPSVSKCKVWLCIKRKTLFVVVMIIKFEDKKKLGDKLCQDQAGQLNKFVDLGMWKAKYLKLGQWSEVVKRKKCE